MDKREFFDKYHKELSDKTGVPIKVVCMLRDLMIGEKKNLQETIEFVGKRVGFLGKKSHKRGRRYQLWAATLAVLNSASFSDLETILQKTEYDRELDLGNSVPPT